MPPCRPSVRRLGLLDKMPPAARARQLARPQPIQIGRGKEDRPRTGHGVAWRAEEMNCAHRAAGYSMLMQLLDKMLARHVQRGELTITDHAGKVWHYGAPDPELRPVAVR